MRTKLLSERLQRSKTAAFWLCWQLTKTSTKEYNLSINQLKLVATQQKVNIILSEWYGRTGNNIQQILIALAHAEEFKGSFEVSLKKLMEAGLSDLLSPLSIDFSPGRKTTTQFVSRFFHYTENTFNRSTLRRMRFEQGTQPRRECLLGLQWIEKNIHNVAQQRLKRQLKPQQVPTPPSEDLVLCLRSGEIQDLKYSYYMTNPLCFYENLANQFEHVIIVTEPGNEHYLLRRICNLFKRHTIEFIRYEDRDRGFELLRQATNLATSGVSTFPIAAALLSDNLRALHCTDNFMDEHLNPRMINKEKVDVQMMKLPGFEAQWRTSEQRKKLLMAYRP